MDALRFELRQNRSVLISNKPINLSRWFVLLPGCAVQHSRHSSRASRCQRCDFFSPPAIGLAHYADGHCFPWIWRQSAKRELGNITHRQLRCGLPHCCSCVHADKAHRSRHVVVCRDRSCCVARWCGCRVAGFGHETLSALLYAPLDAVSERHVQVKPRANFEQCQKEQRQKFVN
jgi:hypothetical protein